MKKLNIFLILLAAATLVVSCKKDSTPVPEETVSTEEAADIIAQSVGTDSGGAGFVMADASQLGKDNPASEKSVMTDSTFTAEGTVGNSSYNFSLTYGWEVALNSTARRTELKLNFETSGTTNSVRVKSEGSSKGDYVLYGLAEADTEYVLNGDYKRTGTTKISAVSAAKEKTLTSVVDIVFSDVKIDKSTLKIKSGEATVKFTGTNEDGDSFSITGSITYSDNGTAVLTIGEKTFTIDIQEEGLSSKS